MRTVLLASLRVHTRRYLAAALAIAVGVAFIVVTNALSSAARDGMVAGVDLPYRNADAVVSDIDGTQAAALVKRARDRGDSAAVLGWSMQQVSGDGIVGDQVDVGAVADDSRMRWQKVVAGRMPRGDGEAVVDVNAAKSLHAAVGDVIRVGSGARARDVTVVGTVDSPSASVSSSVYLTWNAISAVTPRFYVDSVAYASAGGSTDGLVEALRSATDGSVQTVRDFTDDRTQELAQGVDVLGYLLLLFAGIALFVSVLVIANTFSILFAQRTRDFALLRCVGSTRRQLLRSVRREALALGAVASAAGLAVGVALGYGVVALVAALIPRAPLGAVSLDPRWLVSAYGLGIGVTLVASWLPTRRVSLVSPLEALRTEEVAEISSSAGRLRMVLAAGSLLAGLVGMGLAVAAESAPLMVLGGGLSFIGVLLLGPVLVPALVRLIGGAAGRLLGPSVRLATGNAVRQPRRTAATTASLLIGVTLTTAVLTGLAGARTSVDDDMKAEHPVDAILTGSTAPLPGDLVADVRNAEGVQDAAEVPGVLAKISNGVGALALLAPTRAAHTVERAELPRPGPRELVLPYDVAPDAARVTVTVGDRTVRLKVRTSEGFGTAGLVAPGTLRALGSDGIRAVWVRAEEGADPEDLGGDLDALAGPAKADVESGLQKRAYVTRQLTILTGAVVGLLGVAVVIALVGIGNTLGLSVLERRREHALLRALGLTRRQLRSTLAAEAVLLSVVATVLGTTLGIGYAWVGNETLIRPAIGGVMTVPWDQLAIVVVVSGLAGLAACVLPARRAARTAPAEGLAAD